jgi:hypothetical protein
MAGNEQAFCMHLITVRYGACIYKQEELRIKIRGSFNLTCSILLKIKPALKGALRGQMYGFSC